MSNDRLKKSEKHKKKHIAPATCRVFEFGVDDSMQFKDLFQGCFFVLILANFFTNLNSSAAVHVS